MKILVTGGSGMVGAPLIVELEKAGHQVLRAVRAPRRAGPGEVSWDPANGLAPDDRLQGLDAVFHLAGENIAAGRWNARRKAAIRDSRVEATRLLAHSLAALNEPPACLICASAVGYYGDGGTTELFEDSPAGTSFLAEVARDWEAAAEPARAAGIRTVHMRLGAVLHPSAGALKAMMPPFKMGAGGPMGSGKQYMPWISLHDAVCAFLHALKDESLHGPVNTIAPQAVTNGQFAKALGRALKRPAFLPLPAFVARLVIGEMANELLLSSVRAVPRKLEQAAFAFEHADIDTALSSMLRSSGNGSEVSLKPAHGGADS